MSGLFASDRPAAFARIAVERSFDAFPEGLTYSIPASLGDLRVGDRVKVPLGRMRHPVIGYVVDLEASAPPDLETIRPVVSRDSGSLSLPSQLVDLARWISGYYVCPMGVTLAGILPAAVKRSAGVVMLTLVDLGDPPPASLKIPPKQRAILDALHSLPLDERPIERRALLDRAGVAGNAPLLKLVGKGVVRLERRTSIEAEWESQTLDDRLPPTLTDEQQTVLRAIAPTLDAGFSTHLLFGVTGSGKTEIYIRLIEQVAAAGRISIVLVPEISLTPQTGGRLISRLQGRRVAVLHSGLTAAQRHHQWAMVREGKADVVLGARSAVFAPVPDGRLGLIIVDEEHDGSFKQDQAPRYHGRDVAVRRAQLAGCPILLGSATPSLESWHNATVRRAYQLHELRHRAPGLRLPRVELVDFAHERRARTDRRVHLIGPHLEQAIDRTLIAGGQIILLLNRRGYGNYVACPDHGCGWIMTCDNCDAAMVCHRDSPDPRGYVRCHHCLAEQRVPSVCPRSGHAISVFGFGTQRVEEELTRKFSLLQPGSTLLRVDSDTMPKASQWRDALTRFAAGDIRVLLGTQMIAKGLDFPNVRLVGVINADTAINLPDFRAAERTFQLVSQVAGRCGRGQDGGIAIVQTFQPGAPAIRLAADHRFDEFAAQELADRARAGLPPITRMVRLIVRDVDLAECVRKARILAARLRDLAAPDMVIRGPSPCPISRIARKHRHQIEITAPTAGAIQQLLAAARSQGLLALGEELAVDVDPVAML